MAAAPIPIAKVSFGGGEYSSYLWGRPDLQKYAIGAKLLYNMFVHPQGGASNRGGTHFIAEAKFENKDIRVLPFEFSSDQTYVIEAGDEYFRFYTDGGQIQTTLADVTGWVTLTNYEVGDFVKESSVIYYCIVAHTSGVFATDLSNGKWVAQTIYEVPSPYEESELASVRYVQSADVLFAVSPNIRPKMIERFGNVDWRVEDYPFTDGPFMLQNTDDSITLTPSATTGAGVTLNASTNMFNPLHVGGLWQLRQTMPGEVNSTAFASVTAGTAIACGGTWRLITHGTWTGTLIVEKSFDNGSTWINVRTFTSVNDNNINTFGTEDNQSGNKFLVRTRMTVYSSGTCNADLTSDQFYQIGVFRTTAYNSPIQITGEVLTDLGNLNACIDWSEGSWSDYRGWPERIIFSQDRLVFGGTRSEPAGEWMTNAGDYYTFKRSQPLLATDGISIPVPSKKLNKINGYVPLLGLVALTSSGEFRIGEPGSVLSPLTVTAEPNSSYGSYGVDPVIVGNRAIYVQSSGRVVRDLSYSFAAGGFEGSNLSILSTHLFKGYTITELAYQQDPDSIVWAIRSDGALLSMTYLREQEVLAWTHHDTNYGDDLFKSVCTIQGTGYNEVWFAVQRGVKRFIERLDERMASTASEDQFFVDCGISYDGAPATVITGLDHLEGKEVAVLADGNVLYDADNTITVASGQITLASAYSKVHVGLPYISKLQTLKLETPGTTTIAGKQVKTSQITVQVVESRGGKIGPDFDTLFAFTDAWRGLTGSILDLYTGDLKETLAGGYQGGAEICIQQSQPLPITVTGVIPEITVGGSVTLQGSLS